MLLVKVDEEKKMALKEKKANKIDQAKKHLTAMKQAEKEIEDLYKLYPKLRKNKPQA